MKRAARTVKTARQLAQRQRREQRELAEVLLERVARWFYPVRDEGAPPRID